MPLTLTTAQIASLQALVAGQQHGSTQLVGVNDALYLIMLAQVGVAEATNDTQVYKATTADPTSWTLVATYASSGPPIQTSGAQDCPCCVAGTIIYIVGTSVDSNFAPAHVNLVLHRFDTTTDTFLADSALSANQSGAGNQLWSISAFNNGQLLVSSTIGPPTFAANFGVQLYDPAFDTWTLAVSISADSSGIVQQIHDPISDLAFLFYQKGTTRVIRCATVDDTLTFTDVVAATFTAAGPFPTTEIGLPIITTDTNEVVLPIRVFPLAGPPVLKAARATIQATPVFSVDLVEDCSTLPVNSQVQAWDQIAGPGWCALDIGGLLYVFYAIDNGELDNLNSQAFLYYRTSTGAGVWSAPTLIFSTVIPGELLIPYAINNASFSPLIMLGVIDPTLWDAFASFTMFVLYGSVTPPVVVSTTQYIDQNSIAVLPLPMLPIADSTGLVRSNPAGCMPPKRLRG